MKKQVTKKAAVKFNYAQLAKDLLDFRVKQDKSFTQMQDLTGVKRATLYRLEAAKHTADVETVNAVCIGIGKNLMSYFK